MTTFLDSAVDKMEIFQGLAATAVRLSIDKGIFREDNESLFTIFHLKEKRLQGESQQQQTVFSFPPHSNSHALIIKTENLNHQNRHQTFAPSHLCWFMCLRN